MSASACPVPAWLLELIVCPSSREPLEWDEATGRLVARRAGLSYPVRGDIPVLLPEEARPWPPLDDQEGLQPDG